MTMQLATTAESLEGKIRIAVEKHAEELRETHIKKAVENFEVELRCQIGTLAIALAEYYSVEKFGQEILIRVKIEDVRK